MARTDKAGSQQWTAVSPFLGLVSSSSELCVAKSCNVSPMCVGSWDGVTYLRYTVLTSPEKGETAVHCCNPALSVLVMLVFRKVFHLISALQSIACLYTQFLAHQISCRLYSYVGTVYCMRSRAVSHSFINFWTVSLLRSNIRRAFKAWYWPCG